MNATMIDILTPVRHGEFIRGDVIAALTAQDVDLTWYVDSGPDRPVTPSEREVLAIGSCGDFWAGQKCHMVPIITKRRALAGRGSGPYVFMLDADILLPMPSLLGGLARALDRWSDVGATGAVYHVDWPCFRYHVAAGCMMVRRADWERVQPLRGTACECFNIKTALERLGKRTVPIDPYRLHAHQWKRVDFRTAAVTPEAPCPMCGLIRNPTEPPRIERVELSLGSDGSADRSALEELVRRHGDAFAVRFGASRPEG